MTQAPKTERLYPDEQAGTLAVILRFLKGILIGIGAILPGLSGGVLSVIFGLYQPILDLFSKFTDRFVRRLKYLFPVILGAGLGILIFSVFVSYAFESYQVIFVCLFMGFVIGTLPSLWRTAGLQGRNTTDIITMLIATAGIYLSLTMISQAQMGTISDSFLNWVVAGALIGLGMIVPGMSPSNFLIYFGMYDRMTDAIKGFDFAVIIPLMLGALLSVLIFSRLVNSLLEKHYSIFYHIIVGLVIGSTIAIVPQVIVPGFSAPSLEAMGLSLPVTVVLALVALALGALFSFAFSKFEDRVERE